MTELNIERIKRAVIRKYPYFASIALFNVPIIADNSIKTIAVCVEPTDSGNLKVKCIAYNSDFLDSLSFDNQLFVLAHESCHIAFEHFKRSLDKPAKDINRKYEEYCKEVSNERLRKIKRLELEKKYYKIWNIATDACINAFLMHDGLQMPENVIDKQTGKPMNFVNIADGLYRNAETIYDKLVKKEEAKEQSELIIPLDGDQIGGSLDNIDIDNYEGIDSHENWTGDLTNEQKEDIASKYNENKISKKIDESNTFKKNKTERERIIRESLKESLNEVNKEISLSIDKQSKPILSWKSLLIRSNEDEEEIWGYRRSNIYMPNARIEDRVQDERAITEVILDASPSIKDRLLKQFLNQLVPMYKETKIKVGCFSDTFYGFTEIKTIQQIEDYKIIRNPLRGTNFEAAATAFTKNNGHGRINKIVFTDGLLDDIPQHIQRTRVNDIIWIVFGDKMNFKPVGGRIIKVDKESLNAMLDCTNQNEAKNNIKILRKSDVHGNK